MPSNVLATHNTVNTGRLKELTEQSSALQKAIEAKKREAKEKEELAAKQAAAKKLHEQAANRLAGDIRVTEGKIDATENKIEATGRSIEQQLRSISAKESELVTKRQEVNESAAELFIAQNSTSSLMSVVASESIGSALNEVAALSSLSDKLIEDATELDRQRTELLAVKARLDEEKQNYESQKQQLAAYEKALDGQKQQKVILASEAQKAQLQLTLEAKGATAEAEQLRKQFAAISNEVAAMRRAASRSTVATASRSSATSALGFTWPIGGGISTYFGGSTPFQRFHTGLDVAGAAGDAIVASNSGVVTTVTKMCCSEFANTIDKSYGYGNWIEIKHDNGYVTRYAHMLEMIVSPGDRVERAQTIGYRGGGRGMAGSGWSTGPHLHFEVWDSQGPFDPMQVLPN